MLEGLDRVPWAELGHAYGEASDVPDQLRALACADEEKREDALYSLYGNIYHQGTVYSATAHAVPFLLEMALSPDVQVRPEILEFLSILAHGSSYLEAHRHMSLFAREREAPDFAERLAEERGWVKAARDAVVEGFPVYVGLLRDADPEVRAASALMIGQFDDRKREAFALLRAHVEGGESDEMVVIACLIAAGGLAEDDAAATAWLTAFFAGEARPGARIAAATALAHAMHAALPAEALEAIVVAVADPAQASHVFDRLPWSDHDIASICPIALGFAGEAAMHALPDLQRLMTGIDMLPALSIAAVLMHIAFSGKPVTLGTSFAQLTGPQRSVLRAIAARRDFEGFGNLYELLEAYGLPDDLARLRTYIDEAPQAAEHA